MTIFVDFFLCSQVESWCFMWLSFSSGSLTSICRVSRIMPKNVRVLVSPSNFSKARGIPLLEGYGWMSTQAVGGRNF